MRHPYLLLFVLFQLLAGALPGQIRITSAPRDTAKFNNRLYKQELGLAIQGIFSGYVGGSLVWKVRDDRGKLIPVSYANFWRFQAGVSGRTFTGYQDSLTVNNITVNNVNPSQSTNSVWVTVGRERVNFFNRFNLFYGWEAGPTFAYERSNQTVTTPVFGPSGGIVAYQYVPLVMKELRLGAYAAAFLGVKYHCTERISLSFETGFHLAYAYARRKIALTLNNVVTQSTPTSYQNVDYGLNYLRFITLNYHFKQY